ncbi:hypothetical protein QE152_g14219 [Popillia japonica]|uniref:Uncharacterized protein n=1 Tax=Popillia japonica TaxID=7064 RepID=A0AAW1LAD2_POPJA
MLHTLVYAGAYTVIKLNKQKVPVEEQRENRPKLNIPSWERRLMNKINKLRKRPKLNIPSWERRLMNKINKLRKSIGVLTQAIRDNPSQKVKHAERRIIEQHKNEKYNKREEVRTPTDE